MKIGTDPADLPILEGDILSSHVHHFILVHGVQLNLFRQPIDSSGSFFFCLFNKEGRTQAYIGGVKFSNLMQFVVY